MVTELKDPLFSPQRDEGSCVWRAEIWSNLPTYRGASHKRSLKVDMTIGAMNIQCANRTKHKWR